MKPIRYQGKIAHIAKTYKKRFSIFLACRQGAVALNYDKWMPQSMTKSITSCIVFWINFWLIFEPSWLPKSMQNLLKIVVKNNSKNDTILVGFSVPLGSVWRPRWFQNPSKVDHKTTCKMDHFLSGFLGATLELREWGGSLLHISAPYKGALQWGILALHIVPPGHGGRYNAMK